VGSGDIPRESDAAAGDDAEGALAQAAIETLRWRVIAAVRRTCPAWLAERAEDIVQNVLTQLVAQARASEGERTYSAIYLEKAAYGATVAEIRRLCRRREESMEERETVLETPARYAGPERDAAAHEIARGIQDCLAQLLPSRRMAVALHLYGCTVPETARRLGWTPKKTENLVLRGLHQLRSCLSAKGLRP